MHSGGGEGGEGGDESPEPTSPEPEPGSSNSAIAEGSREISMSSFILDQVEGYSVRCVTRAPGTVKNKL